MSEVADDDADDDAVNAQGRGENLGNQHLGEESPVLSVTQSATGSTDTDGKTTVRECSLPLPTHNVRDAHAQTSAEDGVASVVPRGVVEVRFQVFVHIAAESQLVDEDDGNDNAVDGVCFAENDTTRHHAQKRESPT